MKKFISLLLSVTLAISMLGCAGLGNAGSSRTYENKNLNAGTAAYTIMVYIDGANLESDYGLASEDIQEMISAAYSREDTNVIIQTGGTKKWSMEEIATDKIGRYRVSEGSLELLEQLPQQNMVKKETLIDFINYCYGSFPANRYGLILWDHGAGPIIGYGVDQNYGENESMSLTSLKEALETSAIGKQPLEFLGFDSCLMASIEIAHILSPFANYLFASQETEPGQGWDYDKWLSTLGVDPQMTGDALGKAIVQTFIDYYKQNNLDDSNLTLSVIDMKNVESLVAAFESFISTVDLTKISFKEVAEGRSNTKEFGFSAAYEHHYDVVDIGDLAKQFSEENAQESTNLTNALTNTVLYSEKGQHEDIANGLSVYFPYNGREFLNESMDVYRELGFSSKYVSYLDGFVTTLTGTPVAQLNNISRTLVTSEGSPDRAQGTRYKTSIEPDQVSDIESIYAVVWQEMFDGTYRQVYRDDNVHIDEATGEIYSEFNGRVTTIDGEIACLYETAKGENFVRYNVPGFINGEFVNLQVIFDDKSPDGRVLGSSPVVEGMQPSARQILPVKEGDELAMCYASELPENYTEYINAAAEEFTEYSASGTSWVTGNTSPTSKTVSVSTMDLRAGNYLFGFMVEDLQGNSYATEPLPFTYFKVKN